MYGCTWGFAGRAESAIDFLAGHERPRENNCARCGHRTRKCSPRAFRTDKSEPLAICGTISSIDALNYRRTSKLPEHLKFYFFIFLCQCGHEETRTVVLNIYWDFSSELLIKGTLTATAHDRVVGMSALGQKRTCAVHQAMSALCQKRTFFTTTLTLSCSKFPFVQADTGQTHTSRTRNNHLVWVSASHHTLCSHKNTGKHLSAFAQRLGDRIWDK